MFANRGPAPEAARVIGGLIKGFVGFVAEEAAFAAATGVVGSVLKWGWRLARGGRKAETVRRIVCDAPKPVAGAADETVDLFRAVSPEEFDDIFKIGGFRPAPHSLQGKQFGLNLDEVLKLAEFFPEASAVVRARIPKSVLKQLDLTPVDPSILRAGSVTAQPGSQLRQLNENLLKLDQAF
ncbi:MAG: hypothetical protein R3F60_32880 [bacterium]